MIQLHTDEIAHVAHISRQLEKLHDARDELGDTAETNVGDVSVKIPAAAVRAEIDKEIVVLTKIVEAYGITILPGKGRQHRR